MLWMISAVTTPLALALYLCITDQIELFPWNSVSATQRPLKILLSLTNYIPLLFVALAFLFGTHILMISALAIIFIFYIILYVACWWIPYFSGAFQQRRQEKLFARTITALPRMRKYPALRAEHMVVGALIALMLVSAINTIVISW